MTDLVFNGINGSTGEYLLSGVTTQDIAAVARGEELDTQHVKELVRRHERAQVVTLGVRDGVDPRRLDQAGWGVVFAFADGDAVAERREALAPLLDLRKAQAGDLYREFTGPDAVRPGEKKRDWLARHGMGPGPADPDKVPYYLMIVADPESIPFRFQYQLDVQYAAGRVCFDSLDQYERYAKSVVAAENGQPARQKRSTFFGVRNPGDGATILSADKLVAPLGQQLAADTPDWQIDVKLKDEARKADLAALLASDERPALLFTASHGMGFSKGDDRQLPHQGALLCQDWPGPLVWGQQPIPPEHYFAGDDLADDADVAGLVAFCFACYGAGTPRLDDFAHAAGLQQEIAAKSFIAALPQRLLTHPKGGALAVVGHVERAWGYSFVWPKAGAQLAVWEATFKRLLAGHPVGSAMEFFNERYSELASELSVELEDIKFGADFDEDDLAGLWTANNDSRSYVIVGDPAVRLALSS